MRKNVVQIITRMVPGGASNIVFDLIKFGSDRYDITLITGIEDLPLNLNEKLPNISIKIVPELKRNISPLHDFIATRKIISLLVKQKVDIVHTHTSKAGFIGRIAAKYCKIPIIIHTTHGLIYIPDSNIPGIPDFSIVNKMFLILERWAGKYTDALTVLSNAEKKMCHTLNLANEQKVHTISNGIDLERYTKNEDAGNAVRKSLGIDQSEIVILSVGRLTSEKGHSFLLKGFFRLLDRHESIRLIIAGDGPERINLESQISDSSNTQNVIFSGYSNDIPSLLSAADIFVLPSLYEGFGLAIIEAMAVGLPVIASNVGGIPEIINSKNNGFLFKKGDVTELTEQLNELVMNRQKRTELGRNALKTSKKYSLQKMLDSYYALYDQN